MEIRESDKRFLEFFGITPQNINIIRSNVFNQIHEIVFHGRGGYNYWDVYNMPIWLRRLTYKKIEKYLKDENERIDNQNNTITDQNAADKMAKPPQINNTYTVNTKTPRK